MPKDLKKNTSTAFKKNIHYLCLFAGDQTYFSHGLCVLTPSHST